MDICIEQISPTASALDVKRSIARALQTSAFAQGPLFNFEVSVDSRKSAGQYRCGLLKLPTYDIGLCFLREFGGAKPSRLVKMALTTLVFIARQLPLRSPNLNNTRSPPQHVKSEDQQRRDRLYESIRACNLPVLGIQFGWECRDGVFSAEWEKYCVGKGRLSFNPYRREFTIKISDDTHNLIIVVQAAQVSWVAPTPISLEKSALFLSLQYPASYEYEPLGNSESRNQDPPLRHRLQFIDDHHARCVQWASLAIRLECEGMQTPTLQWLCGHAQVRHRDFTYPVEYRGLFSPLVQKRYNQWVQSLPWEIAFQVEAITRDRLTDLKEMLSLRSDLLGMSEQEGTVFTVAFLQQFASHLKEASERRVLSPGVVDHVHEVYLRCRRRFQPPEIEMEDRDDNMDTFLCPHIMVSPTTQRLQGPAPERSNRIIRKYWKYRHNFIPVTFVDDAQLPVQYRFDRQVDTLRFIRERYGDVLDKGVTIARRHFDWLRYSMSGLKEHTFWFVQPFDVTSDSGETEKVTPETILQDIGHFPDDSELIRCPALLGARQALAFTSTDATLTVEAEEIMYIDDVLDTSGTRAFTDGVGTISPDLAREIWDGLCLSGHYRRLRHLDPPAAYHFRLGGAKGMLSVDYRLTGRAVCLRPSNVKFDAPHSRQIEIATVFYKPGKPVLNRNLIMLFQGLGIRGGLSVLRSLQDAVVSDTKAAQESLESTVKLLDSYGLGTLYQLSSFLRNMHRLGLRPSDLGTFYQQLIQFIIHSVLRDLKYRARIPVPGYTLPGIADVHGYLPEGHIFAYVVPVDGSDPVYLEGPVMIYRSPTVHPGDIQTVHAIGKPPPDSPFEREPLRNTVVFSILRVRPLSSCLSGGDLDGDVYVLISYGPLLISRPLGPYPPADYAPARRKRLDRPATKADMIDFVTEFLYSDNIGYISTEWLLQADQQKTGIFSKECLLLAELHSAAVDYPKSGIRVPMHRIPKRKQRVKPDWSKPEDLSNNDAHNYYESKSWLGRLYRAIELPELPQFDQDVRQEPMRYDEGGSALQDVRMRLEDRLSTPQDAVETAVRREVSKYIDVDCCDLVPLQELCVLYDDYRARLVAIRHDFTLTASYPTANTPLTEQEVMLCTISAPSSQHRRRKNLVSGMREQTGHLCRSVRDGLASHPDPDDDEEPCFDDFIRTCKTTLQRAWIAYGLSLINRGESGAESFGCLVLGEIFDTIDRINECTTALQDKHHQ